jgi:2-keto-4-pentenoate hydratase
MHRILLAAASLALAAPAFAACPSEGEIARYTSLVAAGQRTPSFGPDLSLADGQCAQDKVVAILQRQWGAPAGYKVGLTNTAVQQRFGVDHPLTGTIYRSTVTRQSGAELPLSAGAAMSVEPDLLVRVRDEGINQAGRDHVAILRHLDQVIPFIELPDLPFAQGELLNGPNLLAINVGARDGVLGTPIPVQANAEFAAALGTMTVTFSDDTGKEIAKAPGTALLGHPLDVIPWLVEDLAKRGRRLHAGEYISLGGFSPSIPPQAGRTYTVRYDGLVAQPVSVSVRFR